MELGKLTAGDLQAIVPRNGNGYLALSQQETYKVAEALLNYSVAANEKIPEQTISAWIEQFKKMGLSLNEILTVIDKAKYVKKYGNTSFDTFAEVLTEHGLLFSKAEMISKAREMAMGIYENEYKSLLAKIEMERTANEETRWSEERLNKFFANIQERQDQISEEINKVIDVIQRKCDEKFDNFEMFTLNKILEGERKKP